MVTADQVTLRGNGTRELSLHADSGAITGVILISRMRRAIDELADIADSTAINSTSCSLAPIPTSPSLLRAPA